MKLLSCLIFLPLLMGLVLMLLPRRQGILVKWLTLIVALLEFILSLNLYVRFESNESMQFVEKLAWISRLGIEYHVGVDGISLFFVLITAAFIPLGMLGAWKTITHNEKQFYTLLLLLEAGLLGTVLALDLFLFYIFWELMLIPMFFLIGLWGGANRIRAVIKFVIYTMAGSLVLLVGIIYLASLYYEQTGQWSFSLLALSQVSIPMEVRGWMFVAFSLAFLIKAPVFPFHTWLPDTYAEAPASVTFLLSAVMAKMGIYGLLRFSLPLFPDVAAQWSGLLMSLAVIGIIYGAVIALVQTDIKRLVAYASISHLSLIALGVFAWQRTSLEGSIYHVVNHAVSTGALFLLIGIIEEKYQERQLSRLGGLATIAPVYAFFFLLMTLSSIGLPGLNGFIGEFLILLGVLSEFPMIGMLATLTLILAAGYMLWMIQRLLFGALNANDLTPWSLSFRQGLMITPLAVLAVCLGLFTAPILEKIRPAIQSQQTPIIKTLQAYIPLNLQEGDIP